MTTHTYIEISQDIQFSPKSELLSILEQLMPIKFFVNRESTIDMNGFIYRFHKDISIITDKCPALLISTDIDSPNIDKVETEVIFADDLSVPFPFRGRKLRTKISLFESHLSVSRNEKILASNEQGPIWTVSEKEGAKCFRSALPLPYLTAEHNFNDIFNGECFLEMLIFLEFIREISPKTLYQNAPLRASFIIDDPNLHWPKYGFVDYREIASKAQKENYHFSFATIPLDTWYTNKATAKIFRENSKWLSLLVHGNNHAKKELALPYSDDSRKLLLKQANQRIQYLEKKANLMVSRVMVPPHGACSSAMLSDLPNYGFESACISAGSLRAHNQDMPWIKTLGFFPSEIIQGCPVLPRWGLTGNVENSLLIAAYLGQPLILRGHHQDLKDGGEVFSKFANYINGIGDVLWSNMKELSGLNYQWKMEGTKCHIKPLGINTVFKLPGKAVEIIIDSPSSIGDYHWQILSPDGGLVNIPTEVSFPISENMSEEVVLKRNSGTEQLLLSKNIISTEPSLILRRLLTEIRDRLLLS
jgi:hypothetical protein